MTGRLARSVFATLPDGREVEAVELGNRAGMRVRILAWGATIHAIEAPDRDGRMADVVLGFPDIAGYLDNVPYFGATVGRYANRIAAGRFVLDGQSYQLACNNGGNALHGGVAGFNRRLWSIAADDSADTQPGERAVTLAYTSADGEEGYPGTLHVTARFALDEGNRLTIDYTARTDRSTIVNLTGHSYFNLAGEGSGTALNQLLTIPAERFTPVDGGLIPTGELRAVAGTPFDFRAPRRIGSRVRDDDEQLVRAQGYDHNFVLAERPGDVPRLAAMLQDPASGRAVEVWSDRPGLQFYSGNFLDATIVGKSGRMYRQGDGVCLEPQLFPDTPNRPEFGSARLAPRETYRHRIAYRFSAST